MIVGVQGTSSFDDYKVFLRAMAVSMSSLTDENFYIYSAGPANINNMVSEFVNLSERGLKSRGKKIKMVKVAPSWILENMSDIQYFIFLSKPKEDASNLVEQAKRTGVEYGIFQY